MGGEKRRSQRARLVKPVEVALYLPDGTYVIHHGGTESVSAHGALLRMKQEIAAGQLVALRTRPEACTPARIVRFEPRQPDGLLPVAIELLYPNKEFWGASPA